MKVYGVYSDFTKEDPLSTLKALSVNYFVNQKMTKTMSFMKLTVVTANQSPSMNLNGL